MKYIKDTLDFKIEEPSVITLGKFDGLHSGHRYLMEAMQKGKEQGLKCVIFTFDIPPKAIHKGTYNVCLLYTSPSPRDPKTSRMPSSA